MISIQGFESAFRYMDLFLEGLVCTITLSALTVVFGFVLAMVLALMRMSTWQPLKFLRKSKDGHPKGGFIGAVSRFNPLRFLASVYVEIFRATPMLVQLFIVYYVILGDISLPAFKLFGFIRFERMVPGVIALSLNSAAYLSEIIRSGIQSIDHGQTEAARSLGMSSVQTMRCIILQPTSIADSSGRKVAV